MAAGALLAAREAHPDRAHEAVLVKVKHDTRTRGACCGQCSPTEGRMEVVRVEDPGSAEANRLGHLLGAQAAAQQAERGAGDIETGRLALEQLGGLAELLADEPHQVPHDPLLPTGGAIAVVQEQDHASRKPIAGRPPSGGGERRQT